jgi:hypothetical protein
MSVIGGQKQKDDIKIFKKSTARETRQAVSCNVLDMNGQPASLADTRAFSGLIITVIKMSITIYP